MSLYIQLGQEMSVNISKKKRDVLINRVKSIKDFISSCPQDQNTQNLLGYIGDILKEINRKKYGLVFEEHREKIDELLSTHIPILAEEPDLAINNGGEQNFLIEGDNLAALQLLEKTHKSKIDVIYIDPPYNTGNKDFIYDDNYVDSTDEFKHSKWLSFMEKRLTIARELLSESGVIFISIDDNEQADLKILCDEIFGERNFAGQIILKTATDNNPSQINIEHEYMLCYCKHRNNHQNWKRKSDASKLLISKYEELKSKNLTISEMQKELRKWIRDNREQLPQLAHYNNIDEKGIYSSSSNSSNPHPGGYTYDIIHPVTKKPCPKPQNGWRWPLSTFEKYDKNCEIEWGKDETTQPHVKKRLETSTEYLRSLIYEDNRGTTIELANIFSGEKVFENPKPHNVLARIFDFVTSPSSNILDFFAGSGTTGHAVLKLNAEDGGHRRFILCTNNENNICRDITYQRLKTVITGKRKNGSTYSDGLPGSLKYLKVDFVPVDDQMYYEYADQLLENIRALVELENAVDMDNNQSVSIILDDEELDDFISSIEHHSECKSLYLSHDILISKEQEQKLHKKGIEIKTVPEYFYPDTESRGSDEY